MTYESEFNAFHRRLETFPAIGSQRPILGLGIRIGVVRPYLIVYRYEADGDIVEILRVLHGHRQITASLLQDGPKPG